MADAPKVNIRFLYAWCNDINDTRKFYTNLLGLLETSAVDNKEFGWLCYQCTGMQFMFFRAEQKLAIEQRWADQPGEMAPGAVPIMSFSIEIPADDFKATVRRLSDARVKAAAKYPTWRQSSYWGWTVKDPMGNTVEVYCTPKVTPEGEPKWEA